jgi:hypothetical protein
MELYSADSSASRADGCERSTVVGGRALGYYETISTPPIQLVLNALAEHCGVGGTIRPGVRRIAAWANYASAGRISPILDQLAADGWIAYDPQTGLITLLEDPNGPPITERDRWIDDETESDESAPITPRDRDEAQQDADDGSITPRDRSAQRMEDHVLVAATETQDSAAARYKLPCDAETITLGDRSADLVMAELGTSAKLRAKALAKRPDLTAAQVLATRAHFEPRIAAGLCTDGAFHAALANGEIHAAPHDPDRPIDPAAYAADPAYQLGSAALEGGPSIRDRALSLLGPWTAENHAAQVRDSMFLQGRLGAGDSDQEALVALADYRKAVRR